MPAALVCASGLVPTCLVSRLARREFPWPTLVRVKRSQRLNKATPAVLAVSTRGARRPLGYSSQQDSCDGIGNHCDAMTSSVGRSTWTCPTEASLLMRMRVRECSQVRLAVRLGEPDGEQGKQTWGFTCMGFLPLDHSTTLHHTTILPPACRRPA